MADLFDDSRASEVESKRLRAEAGLASRSRVSHEVVAHDMDNFLSIDFVYNLRVHICRRAHVARHWRVILRIKLACAQVSHF